MDISLVAPARVKWMPSLFLPVFTSCAAAQTYTNPVATPVAEDGCWTT